MKLKLIFIICFFAFPAYFILTKKKPQSHPCNPVVAHSFKLNNPFQSDLDSLEFETYEHNAFEFLSARIHFDSMKTIFSKFSILTDERTIPTKILMYYPKQIDTNSHLDINECLALSSYTVIDDKVFYKLFKKENGKYKNIEELNAQLPGIYCVGYPTRTLFTALDSVCTSISILGLDSSLIGKKFEKVPFRYKRQVKDYIKKNGRL